MIRKKLIRLYQEFVVRRSKNGPYKFLVQKLSSKMDISLAESIFQSDYYRGQLKPLPLEVSNIKKVIVFAPHQDDEVIGCGGLLTFLKKHECEMTICFLTNGAQPKDEKGSIETRRREAQNVCNLLNAQMFEIGINNIDMVIKKVHLETIQHLLQGDFDALFLPWVFDSPPKHRLCNIVLARCMRKLNWSKQEVHCYQVHTHLLPNSFFDYTDLKDGKERLFDMYTSQMRTQNYKHIAMGLDAWSSRFLPWSAQARYVELFTRLPAIEFLNLIKLYENDIEETFKSNGVCMQAYRNLMKSEMNN